MGKYMKFYVLPRPGIQIFQIPGLMHNYVIQCMRVRLGGIAKQVPRVCVPFLHTGYKRNMHKTHSGSFHDRVNPVRMLDQ